MYIKLPVDLFFYVELKLNDFEVAKSITQGIVRGRPWKSRLCCHFRAQNNLDVQGPLLPMPLGMDIAHLKIIMYLAILTTGTIIFIEHHALTISAPMIYTALCIIIWMRAYPCTRASGRGLGPEN